MAATTKPKITALPRQMSRSVIDAKLPNDNQYEPGATPCPMAATAKLDRMLIRITSTESAGATTDMATRRGATRR